MNKKVKNDVLLENFLNEYFLLPYKSFTKNFGKIIESVISKIIC
jgi:hypothetical protein